MEKKSYLVMISIILLVLIVNMASAGIWDDFLNLFSDEKTIDDLTKDDVYKELILNDASKTEAIMLIKNPVDDISIKRNDIKINFNEVCGNVNSYKLLINSTCEAERVKEYIYGIKEVCYNNSVIDNKTLKNITKEVCYNESFVKDILYENYTYSCYNEFEKIDASDLRNIKVEAEVNWDTCSDGSFGYKIDWIPEIKIDDGITENILINDNWEWWNITYDYKRSINCTNIDDYTPIVINGSNGFTINGEKQIIWTYCSGTGTAVYYNDETDYEIANDTTQIPFEVEFGNGTSYNPTSVWDTNYKMVQHLNEDPSDSQAINSVSNLNNGTSVGDMTSGDLIDGVIGKAWDFDGSNDLLNYGADSSLNILTDITLEVWFNSVGANVNDRGAVLKMEAYKGYGLYTIPSGFSLRTGTGSAWSNSPFYSYLANTWYHAVGRYNGSHLSLFINGTEITPATAFSTGLPSTTANAYSGGHYGAAANFWDVSIDEVRISATARSDSYVNQIFQNAIGTSGYGDLGAEKEQEIPSIYILNGTIKDSNNVLVNNAKIIIINQIDNTIIGTTDSNSTGGWNYTVDIGTYLVVAYDPNNSTRDGDADPYIVVS